MGTSSQHSGAGNAVVPVGDQACESPPAASAGDDASLENNGNGETENVSAQMVYPAIPAIPVNSGLSGARTDMEKGARTLNGLEIRSAASKYVTACGNGYSAAKRMPNSHAVARRLGDIVRSIPNQGHAKTLGKYNLEQMAGNPAEDVLIAMIDSICPRGGTIDEAVARHAMIRTIIDFAAAKAGRFDELSADQMREFFAGFVVQSIGTRIFNEVGTRAIAASSDESGVARVEAILHDFVGGCVRDALKEQKGDLASLNEGEMDKFVDNLYATTRRMIEYMGEAK